MPAMAALVTWLIFIAATAASPNPCDLNESTTTLQSLAGTSDEGSFSCASDADEEHCICTTLRLGWTETAKHLLAQRVQKKQGISAVRNLVQAMHAGTVGVLARLHASYPKHLKIHPAIEWAQDNNYVTLRVRYARYTRGESLFREVDGGVAMSWSDDALRVKAEGDDVPGFINSTLSFWEKIDVAEATYVQVQGGVVFEARKAEGGIWPRLLSAKQPPNRIDAVDAGQPLEAGALTRCSADCRNGCGWTEEASACATRCRDQCQAEFATRYSVTS